MSSEKDNEKENARPAIDRLAIGVLTLILGGIGVALLVRSNAKEVRVRSSPERPTMQSIMLPTASPKVFGFSRDPRDAMPRIRRPRPPGMKLAPRGPADTTKAARARRPPRPLHAWVPKAATSVPPHAKYPDDGPPKRRTPLLRVMSEPPGQPVEIDGVRFGATPVSRAIAPGKTSVEVRILGLGYREVQSTVKPNENGDFILSSALEPETDAIRR